MNILNTRKYSFGLSDCIIYKVLMILSILLLIETLLIVYVFHQTTQVELRGLIRDTQKEVLVEYFSENEFTLHAEDKSKN